MKIISSLISTLKSLFLSGLFTLFPLTATILIVHLGYNLIASWIAPIKPLLPELLQQIPGAEFAIVIMSILALGTILRSFIISTIVKQMERLINQIPLIRIIYSSSKILVDFFNVPNPATVQKKVVLIEFPRKGSYNLAFLLASAEGNFQTLLPKEVRNKKEYYRVFMPNSPNPTSGFFLLVPREEVIDTDISFEEAIKTIVSCGIYTPEHFGPAHENPPTAPRSSLVAEEDDSHSSEK